MNYPALALLRIAVSAAWLALGCAIWAQPGFPPQVDLAVKDDEAACQASLNRIFESLLEFQHIHTNLPNYLSDLHPDFIAEPRLFICPAALRTGDYRKGQSGLRDGGIL